MKNIVRFLTVAFALGLFAGLATPARAQMFSEPFTNPTEMSTPVKAPWAPAVTQRYDLRTSPEMIAPRGITTNDVAPFSNFTTPMDTHSYRPFAAVHHAVGTDMLLQATSPVPIPYHNNAPDDPWGTPQFER